MYVPQELAGTYRQVDYKTPSDWIAPLPTAFGVSAFGGGELLQKSRWLLSASYCGGVSWKMGHEATLRLSAGEALLCPAQWVAEACWAPGDIWAFVSLRGGDEIVAWILGERSYFYGNDTDGVVGRLLGRLCRRLGEASALDPYRDSVKAYQLLMGMGQTSREQTSVLSPIVRQAVDLLEQHFAYIAGTGDLAERLGVHRSHLIRLFTLQMGMPPGAYLENVRMEYAKLLLQYKEYNLETVADLVGYSGANYFCKVFRRNQGISPGKYRSLFLHRSSPESSLPKKLADWEKTLHL